MKIKKSLLGQRRGLLEVIEEKSLDLYVVRCDCGTVKELKRNNFFNAYSCGCLKPKPRFPDWPRDKIRLWDLWDSIVKRCTDPQHGLYQQYGARGVTVCKRWENFDLFYEDTKDRLIPGKRLLRKDKSKGYSPENTL